jgi:hypothetical protein
MGIHFVSITRQLAEEQKLPVMVGALVGGVDENGQPVPGVDDRRLLIGVGSTSTNSSFRTGVRSRARSARAGAGSRTVPPGSSASATDASQQARISSPRSGRRSRSRPQYPSWPATDRRKLRQVAQAVLDRRQTQHLAVSAWGVPQCGQRHIGMPGW